MENIKQRTKNPLCGLLEEYNSESDSEDKLQHTVNSFLSEIEEINKPNKVASQKENFWQECFDKSTGYPYYWNTKTDEVTWEMPEEYKLHISTKNNKSSKIQNKETVKEPTTITTVSSAKNAITKKAVKVKPVNSKPSSVKYPTNHSDSEDEKITLIDSYEGHSSSDEDQAPKNAATGTLFPINVDTVSKTNESDAKTSHNSISTAKNTQNNAKAFIGPEIPVTIYSISKNTMELDIISEIEKEKPPDLVSTPTTTDTAIESVPKKETVTTKSIGISLVAGYGDEEDDSEAEEIVESLPPKAANALPFIPSIKETQANNQNNVVSHSTLFPNPTPIDVSQFATQQSDVSKETKDNAAAAEEFQETHSKRNAPNTEVDVKLFKRKRRIAVDVIAVQNQKLPKISNESPLIFDREDSELSSSELSDNARTGFGFSTSAQTQDSVANAVTLGACKGAISFIKAETLNPGSNSNSGDGIKGASEVEKSDKDNFEGKLSEDLKETETTLAEKLSFLCEGREPASAVQIMSIQLATLSTALKSHALSDTYLRKWLQDTCSELVHLEKEAAPAGWLLKWDRSNKRYFYQNQHTNETQWEYPVVDIVGGSEAMDICTTPPPIDDSPATPPPPLIKEDSPSPPPPPTISKKEELERRSKEPLPPGVEAEKKNEEKPNKDKLLVSELDSFYSDLATIESNLTVATTTVKVAASAVAQADETEFTATPSQPSALEEDHPKKKKKAKVKISHGMTMKKKEVSKLVEKWKNVQKNYTD